MTHWYVKELSKLTGVSVQTLHHYDHINLLNPSLRQSNGYRLYTEKDLLRLQQIIALKFFGFELLQIKSLLSGSMDMIEHFSVQATFLEEKAHTLLEASKALKAIISQCHLDQSIPWKSIIHLIEVYRMSQQLEQTWVAKVLTPEELKQYINFEAGLKERFTPQEKDSFKESIKSLTAQIKKHINQDPESAVGMDIAQQFMTVINSFYGKENANLKHSIWHNGFKKGQMNPEHDLTSETVAWLDKATSHYYKSRIYTLLEQVDANPNSDLLEQWNQLLEEMIGDSQSLKDEIIQAVMADSRISDCAKKWVKNPK